MKKEKTVKTYQRRTKSGKIVTVRQHTAKYDAAEALKEAAKKKGAGDELEALKKKSVDKPTEEEVAEFEKLLDSFPEELDERSRKIRLKQFMKAKGKKGRQAEIDETKWEIKEEKKARKVWKANEGFGKRLEKSYDKEHKNSVKDSKDPYSAHGFTKDDFNEWYEGTGSAADKKVAKALRKTLGRKAYNELNDLAADNYKKGGANSFFKKNVHSTATAKTGKSTNSGKSSSAKTENAKEKAAEAKTSKSKTTSAPTKKSNFEKYKISDLHDSVDSSNPNGNMGEYGFFPIKGPKNTLTYKHKETGEIYSTPANSDEWGKGKLYKSLDAFKSAVTTKSTSKEPTKTSATKSAKSSNDTTKSNWRKTADVPLRKKGDMAVGSMNVGKRAIEFEVRPADRGYEVTLYARYGKNDADYLKNIHISTLSDLSKHVRSEIAPRRKLTSRLMDDGEIHYDTIRVKSKKLESQEL